MTLSSILCAAIMISVVGSAFSSQPNNSTSERQILVATTSGRLLGVQQRLATNATVYKFLAVPYAEPPIGSLRFQRPVELRADRQHQTLDAGRPGKTCPQFRHLARFISPLLNLDQNHETSEDCLQLNVFVPATAAIVGAGQRLPVIVWVPGEGFDFADARQFDGSFLADKTQSIVVSVQYRVGALGFLDAPKLGIKGNMGVHDQLMALRWVRKNIAAFGGDPERTTVMGRFSGSMTISSIITAPNRELVRFQGRPLFNRVVLLSGVAVDDWTIERSQEAKVEQLLETAVLRGACKPHDEPIKCLREMPAHQLVALSGYGWKLVADEELVSRAGGPIEAVKRNQFDPEIEAVLMGETGSEGTLCLYRHLLDDSSDFARLIEENRLTGDDLRNIIRDDSLAYFKYNVTESNPVQIALETALGAATRRLGSSDDEAAVHRQRYLEACSSYMVKSHAGRFKRNLLARNRLLEKSFDKRPVEVYHYELNYKPTFSLAPAYVRTAAHGDDIPLIFGLAYKLQHQANEDDLLVTRRMMSYIGNFVHGNDPQITSDHEREEEREQRAEAGARTIQGGRLGAADRPRLSPSQSHLVFTAATINLISESPLSTSVVLATCVLVLALTSYCFVLSLMVFRQHATLASDHSTGPAKRQFHVTSSSSSCNICDNSQGSSIDEVLAAPSKDNRGFCNVFAKLRPNNQHQARAPQRPGDSSPFGAPLAGAAPH